MTTCPPLRRAEHWMGKVREAPAEALSKVKLSLEQSIKKVFDPRAKSEARARRRTVAHQPRSTWCITDPLVQESSKSEMRDGGPKQFEQLPQERADSASSSSSSCVVRCNANTHCACHTGIRIPLYPIVHKASTPCTRTLSEWPGTRTNESDCLPDVCNDSPLLGIASNDIVQRQVWAFSSEPFVGRVDDSDGVRPVRVSSVGLTKASQDTGILSVRAMHVDLRGGGDIHCRVAIA